MIRVVLGGLGLFLLGMLLVTDGLKAIAGLTINRVLTRFTRKPVLGIMSGALVTAIVQSSSAVTLAMIGFVSAGMLTFAQTIGLTLGINLGTTSTGWIVSLIGFKVNIAYLAYPLVAIGTFIRLLAEGKRANWGSVLAGFGLIFVGISTMQNGMEELTTYFNPSSFPGGTLVGNVLLVLIGVIMTVIMQSSSAAMATTLAALYSAAISMEQAGLLVIGQNIGTTVTAVLAMLGSTMAAKRTAMVHVLFNVVTAVVALVIFPIYLQGMHYLVDEQGWTEATTLSAFHTSFNLMGVILFLPFIQPINAIVSRLLTDHGPQLTRHLNPKVLRIPSAAVEASRRATLDVAVMLVEISQEILAGKIKHRTILQKLQAVQLALGEIRRFLANIQPVAGEVTIQQLHTDVLHAVDHLQQLIETLKALDFSKLPTDLSTTREISQELSGSLSRTLGFLKDGDLSLVAQRMEERSLGLAEIRRKQRKELLENTAQMGIEPDTVLVELEAMRWADRVIYHLWRSLYHLSGESGNGSEKKGKKDKKAKTKSKKNKKKLAIKP